MLSSVLLIHNVVKGRRVRCIFGWGLSACSFVRSKYLNTWGFCLIFLIKGERRARFWGVLKVRLKINIQVGCEHKLKYMHVRTLPSLPTPTPLPPTPFLTSFSPPYRSWGRERIVGTGKTRLNCSVLLNQSVLAPLPPKKTFLFVYALTSPS